MPFDPFSPGFAADPYPHYRELREREPVHRTPFGPWVLLRHADCVRLLRDQSLSVDVRKAAAIDPTARLARERLLAEAAPGRALRENRSMLNIDPPDHTRLRRLVSSVFTPRRIGALRPLVSRLVAEHLDRVERRGEMDLIADLAFPLPFQVISEMLGMPEADRDQVREWSHTLVRILDFTIGPDELVAALDAGEAMRAHVAEVIEWKRANPADDLLTALIHAEEDGDALSERELNDQVTLLFIAGHETTVNLIGNGTLALLRHRDQLERWRDDPALDGDAVEELLRFDSPVQLSRRIALEPLEVGGQLVPAGSFVITVLGAANHDPEVFGPDADHLDLGRPTAGRHLSFGSGTHHCLGAALARLQGAEAISGADPPPAQPRGGDRRPAVERSAGPAGAGVAPGVVAGAGRGGSAVRVETDVVVVGAGLAGLTAARHLVADGTEVAVVEARDRVGGRTLNHTLGDGTVVEVGGQWVGPTQNRVLALLGELGLETFPTYTDGDSMSGLGLEVGRYRGKIPRLPAAVLADVFQAQSRLDRLARAVPLEHPWEAPDAEELDGQTWETWIRRTTFTKGGAQFFRVVSDAVFASEPSAFSLLHALFYIHSGKGVDSLIDTAGGAQQDRIVGGSQLIALRMAEQLGDRVRLGHPVRRIEHGPEAAGGVRVVADELERHRPAGGGRRPAHPGGAHRLRALRCPPTATS